MKSLRSVLALIAAVTVVAAIGCQRNTSGAKSVPSSTTVTSAPGPSGPGTTERAGSGLGGMGDGIVPEVIPRNTEGSQMIYRDAGN